MQFTKMQSLGNDFILIDGITQRVDDVIDEKFAKVFCSRRLGIGADGVIVVLSSKRSDFRMLIINSDGSVPEMCGNGMSCFAKFVYETGLTQKDVFSVETGAGIIVPVLSLQDGKVLSLEVDMGAPEFLTEQFIDQGVPAEFVDKVVHIDQGNYEVNAVSMGNPHAVIFVDELRAIDVSELGPKIEALPQFPQGVNVEFVQILNREEIQVDVWERGAGVTLACGTGACATVVAGVRTGRLQRSVQVHLPGGDLRIHYQEDNDRVLMQSNSRTVFKGELDALVTQ
ncbi:MAG: diaminopimelate epimerase [Actinobacteria bacterium]|nr:diaminopimelate epimerase [Actinomycetota bacterium]